MRIPRGPLLVASVLALVAVVGTALAVLQPWLLVLDEQVSEALPVAAPAPTPATSSLPAAPTPPPAPGPSTTGPTPAGSPTAATDATGPTAATPTAPRPTGPIELARGELVSHEHATTGTARVLLLPDGSRVLRLEGLDTSNGPDLHVWLSDAPVLTGRDGWFVFDDGAHVDLGELKGNQGDANYPIPADVDLDALGSVSVWCARFSVSFGAAALT
ncbi:DM13 domain-containing protein [Jannaschia sp. R86511]|uniref:DM13 domain-containing protein n=1 Tax=Jannaschia sp. R86511 TaxID=3093853 RepID=UPI0036D34B9A